jgi:hypothetical protein
MFAARLRSVAVGVESSVQVCGDVSAADLEAISKLAASHPQSIRSLALFGVSVVGAADGAAACDKLASTLANLQRCHTLQLGSAAAAVTGSPVISTPAQASAIASAIGACTTIRTLSLDCAILADDTAVRTAFWESLVESCYHMAELTVISAQESDCEGLSSLLENTAKLAHGASRLRRLWLSHLTGGVSACMPAGSRLSNAIRAMSGRMAAVGFPDSAMTDADVESAVHAVCDHSSRVASLDLSLTDASKDSVSSFAPVCEWLAGRRSALPESICLRRGPVRIVAIPTEPVGIAQARMAGSPGPSCVGPAASIGPGDDRASCCKA